MQSNILIIGGSGMVGKTIAGFLDQGIHIVQFLLEEEEKGKQKMIW